MTIKDKFLELGFVEPVIPDKKFPYNSDEYLFVVEKQYSHDYKFFAYQSKDSRILSIILINTHTYMKVLAELTDASIKYLCDKVNPIELTINKLLHEAYRTVEWYVERYCPDCTGVDFMGCHEGLPWYDIQDDEVDSESMLYCNRYGTKELAIEAGRRGQDSIYQFNVLPIQLFWVKDFCPYPGGRTKSVGDGSAEEAEEFVSQFIDRNVDNLTVVFDFDGLPGFANSWLDEFIGRLVLKFPSVIFRMRGKELSKPDFEYFNESIEEWRKMGKHPNSNFKL